jgi:hypothetical protein
MDLMPDGRIFKRRRIEGITHHGPNKARRGLGMLTVNHRSPKIFNSKHPASFWDLGGRRGLGEWQGTKRRCGQRDKEAIAIIWGREKVFVMWMVDAWVTPICLWTALAHLGSANFLASHGEG